MTSDYAPIPGSTNLPAYLTSKQLAELLGLNPGTLRQWRHQGRGPAYLRIQNAVRYERSVVLAFLASCKVEPSAADNEDGHE